MSARPTTRCRRAPSTAPGSGTPFALNDKLRDVDADRPRPHRRRRRTSSSTATTISMRARATATSCASSRPTTSGWRSSPISAASRSAWPSTATTISTSASAAWGFTAITPERKVEKVDRRDQPQPATRSTTTAGCGSPTTSTSPTTAASSSPRRPCATRCTNGPVDGLEARGNGRIICYDPQQRHDAHGAARPEIPQRHLHRQRRQVDPVRRDLGLLRSSATGSTARRPARPRWCIDNLPGYPDNINLASDGNYWLALVGMRSPALDLAWKMPGFRKRMAQARAASTNGCSRTSTPAACQVQRAAARCSNRSGTCGGENHPMITSMREHRGYLYLGGIMNNRIGRYKLADADPDFVQYDRRWGQERMIARPQGVRRPAARPRRRDHHRAVVRRRAEAEPDPREAPRPSLQLEAPEDLGDRRQGAVRRRRRRRSVRLDGAARAPSVAHASTAPITALCCLPDGGIAVALGGREVQRLRAAASDGRRLRRCRRPALNARQRAVAGAATARCSRPTARRRDRSRTGSTT